MTASPMAAQAAVAPAAPPPVLPAAQAQAVPHVPPPAQAMLAAGTPVYVSLDQDLTTVTSNIGDIFQVTVLRDVVDGATIVIPHGAIGHGEVTDLGRRGGFGKAGLISIALRDVELGGRTVALDGIYREEGENKNGATVATWVMVGVFSGFIQGKDVVIPRGRELKGRTRLALAYTPGAPPPAVPDRSPEPPRPTDAAPGAAAGSPASAAPSAQLSQTGAVPAGTSATNGGRK
jgi:hypothetical protein